jgi:hypothetical protein
LVCKFVINLRSQKDDSFTVQTIIDVNPIDVWKKALQGGRV